MLSLSSSSVPGNVTLDFMDQNMTSKDIFTDLQAEGEKALKRYEAGKIAFMDHDFRFAHFGPLEFEEWVRDWVESIDQLRACLPCIDEARLRVLFENPECVKAKERSIWADNCFAQTEAPSDATLFVFVPVTTPTGIDGVAVILSYGDIPGGEYDLYGVFIDQDAAYKDLKGTLWYK